MGADGGLRRGCLRIDRTWDGEPIGRDEAVSLELSLVAAELRLEFEAPYHGDPAPEAPPGSLDGLWEYEVVELFLLGDDAHYLELEFGPAGHHLGLRLHGARNRVAGAPGMTYRARLEGDRWYGQASVPAADLPAGLRACNAYAIHGVGAARRYLAAAPVPGPRPDFHRLEDFSSLPWGSVN